MRIHRYLLGAALAFGSLTGPVQAETESDPLEAYLLLTTGTFDSSVQAAEDSRYDHAIWRKVEIWPERQDGRWTYTENWIAGEEQPYRQRVTQYTVDEFGAINAQGFLIAEAQNYAGAIDDLSLLNGLTTEDLTATGSCPAFVARTGPTSFESSTVGQSCRNSYKGASYVVSRAIMNEKGFTNWDRGFNANGELVWGPSAGGYQFTRTATE